VEFRRTECAPTRELTLQVLAAETDERGGARDDGDRCERQVVPDAEALRADLPDDLLRSGPADLLRKTTVDNIDTDLAPRWIKPDSLAA
jgi:hypothetical protein